MVRSFERSCCRFISSLNDMIEPKYNIQKVFFPDLSLWVRQNAQKLAIDVFVWQASSIRRMGSQKAIGAVVGSC